MTLSANALNWINTGDLEEIRDQYVESYKDAHGIKARWLYGHPMPTREEFVGMFTRLDDDIEASIARDKAADAAFMARVDGLGLTAWAAENGIKSEYDLMEYNYRTEYMDN